MIHTTACVERAGTNRKCRWKKLWWGDIVHLAAGDMIPADLRILPSQGSLHQPVGADGESEPVEKTGTPCAEDARPLAELPCLAFQGSNVISGSARAVVLAVGGETMFGSMPVRWTKNRPKLLLIRGSARFRAVDPVYGGRWYLWCCCSTGLYKRQLDAGGAFRNFGGGGLGPLKCCR